MQKAKVCILTTVHPSQDSRIFQKEAMTLLRAGYAVTLIAQHEKDETIEGIKIIALPKAKNRLHRFFGLTFKAFSQALKHDADVYHLHDPELLPAGVILKLLKRKKIIYDAHEDYQKQTLSKLYIPRIARKSIAFLIKATEYVVSFFFDGIVTATDDISKNFSYHKRAISVKNFPMISSFTLAKRNNADQKGLLDLIYIGGLAQIRGTSELVRSLELLDTSYQVRLNLYGKFYPAEYEEEIKKLEGFKKVRYHGWVEPEKVPSLLKHYDAGIVCLQPISNYLTSLPVKLFEYMAAGLPVIASNFPLWQEIVEENKCGICVNPLNPKEIAAAIQSLVDQPNVARQMGKNGRKAVEQKYNWKSESQKLLKLYEELTKN